jgi:DNA-binding GntR family transcriptional regulator
MRQLTRTKTEAAYADLRARILDGSLAPGVSLEQSIIAQEYGISTTPVREALRRLESEQLVVVRPHYGPRVADLSVDELHHLFAVRLELDPLAAELAADAATEQEVAAIRARVEAPFRTTAERVPANREFHRSIYEACGNPVLIQVLDSLWNRCDRYRFLLLRDEDSGDVHRHDAEHQAMAEALEAGDGRVLRGLVRDHVERSYHQISRLAKDFSTARTRTPEPVAR